MSARRGTTRRSVSLSREVRADLAKFCETRAVTAAQAVTRGIRALVTGEIDMPPTPRPGSLAIETKILRGQIEPHVKRAVPLMSREELDARVAARNAAIARREAERRAMDASPDAGLSAFVRMAVSHATGSLVDDQLERAASDGIVRTDGEVMDGALNRMLDVLEVQVAAGALCKHCLETDLCRCNGHRQAVGR